MLPMWYHTHSAAQRQKKDENSKLFTYKSLFENIQVFYGDLNTWIIYILYTIQNPIQSGGTHIIEQQRGTEIKTGNNQGQFQRSKSKTCRVKPDCAKEANHMLSFFLLRLFLNVDSLSAHVRHHRRTLDICWLDACGCLADLCSSTQSQWWSRGVRVSKVSRLPPSSRSICSWLMRQREEITCTSPATASCDWSSNRVCI